MSERSSRLEHELPTAGNMRHAMGHFATGVTVVTGTSREGQPVGFACQSFASVSLDPPLVMFCADHRGRAWPVIREAGAFCVNVLRREQEEICARFGSPRGQRFSGLAWTRSPLGAPMIPDVLMRVHARVEVVHEAGDHDIVVGRVASLDTQAGVPLVFYRGRFTTEPQTGHPVPGSVSWGWDDFWG